MGKEIKKAGPAGSLKKPTPAQNELDNYNKFVEKIADQLELAPSGLGKLAPKIFKEKSGLDKVPPKIFTERSRATLEGPPPGKRFKRPTKKPVFKTGTKEKVKGLTQNLAGGGEVFNMSTEMVIDE